MEIIPFLGLKKRKFKKKIHNGMILSTDPSEHIQQQIFWYGYYEKNYVLTWERMLKEDWFVLDIGANIGYYSLIAAGKVKKGHVYAFEPDPRSLVQIKENLALNQIQNIEVIGVAVSDQDANAKFYEAGSENTGMSGLTPPENFTGSEAIVPTIRLDTWIHENQVKRVDCIKMDIEGAEYKALKGMQEILRKYSPVLFIEISNELLQRHGNTSQQIFDLLSSMDYSAYRIVNENTFQHVVDVLEDELVVFAEKSYNFF